MFLHIFGFAVLVAALLFSCGTLVRANTGGIASFRNQSGQIFVQLANAQEDLHASNGAQEDHSPLFGGDLSDEGEKEYINQVTDWLNTLSAFQRQQARKILKESHKEMHELRQAIYNKKLELAALRVDDYNSLKKMPELGMELQNLRMVLREKLREVNERLLKEADIHTSHLVGEGFWLQPLIKKSRPAKPAPEIAPSSAPISMTPLLYCRIGK